MYPIDISRKCYCFSHHPPSTRRKFNSPHLTVQRPFQSNTTHATNSSTIASALSMEHISVPLQQQKITPTCGIARDFYPRIAFLFATSISCSSFHFAGGTVLLPMELCGTMRVKTAYACPLASTCLLTLGLGHRMHSLYHTEMYAII
jgi:hypothetical protein